MFFKELFSQISALMYGYYSRAVYNKEWVMMEGLYIYCKTSSKKQILYLSKVTLQILYLSLGFD